MRLDVGILFFVWDEVSLSSNILTSKIVFYISVIKKTMTRKKNAHLETLFQFEYLSLFSLLIVELRDKIMLRNFDVA